MDTLTAIVTGSSRGLGLGIAHRLAADGHHVVLAARGAEELERAAEAAGGLAVPADVTSPADAARLVATTAGRFGGVDLLVNAAGVPPVLDPIEQITPERFLLGFEVDVTGTLVMTQAALPHLRHRPRAAIVNLVAARGGVLKGAPHLAVSPSQAALLALTRTLESILAPDGVAVHALMPRLSPDGETGRVAAPALGVEFGPDAYTAADAGEAVAELLGLSAAAPSGARGSR